MKTCSKCRETKPLGAFAKKSRAKDGLQPWCRQCNTANLAALSAGNAAHWADNEPTVAEKRCCKCKETKPRSAFAKHRGMNDGLQQSCIACVHANNAQLYITTNAPDFNYVSRALFQKYVEEIDSCCEVTGRFSRQLVLDHDHHTGLFRGLISAGQNRNVGSDMGAMPRLRREAAAKPKTDAPARLEYVRRTSKVEHQITLTMRLTGKSRGDIEAIYDKNVRTTERRAHSVRYRNDKTPAQQCEKV